MGLLWAKGAGWCEGCDYSLTFCYVWTKRRRGDTLGIMLACQFTLDTYWEVLSRDVYLSRAASELEYWHPNIELVHSFYPPDLSLLVPLGVKDPKI